MYRVFALVRLALVAWCSDVCALSVSGSGSGIFLAGSWLVLVSLFPLFLFRLLLSSLSPSALYSLSPSPLAPLCLSSLSLLSLFSLSLFSSSLCLSLCFSHLSLLSLLSPLSPLSPLSVCSLFRPLPLSLPPSASPLHPRLVSSGLSIISRPLRFLSACLFPLSCTLWLNLPSLSVIASVEFLPFVHALQHFCLSKWSGCTAYRADGLR